MTKAKNKTRAYARAWVRAWARVHAVKKLKNLTKNAKICTPLAILKATSCADTHAYIILLPKPSKYLMIFFSYLRNLNLKLWIVKDQ